MKPLIKTTGKITKFGDSYHIILRKNDIERLKLMGKVIIIQIGEIEHDKK